MGFLRILTESVYILLVFILLSSVSADSPDLLTTLSAQNGLSTFTSLFRQQASLVAAAQGGNVTILAPNDAAFETFYSTNLSLPVNYNSADAVEALLSYHILDGVHSQYSLSLLSDPLFIPTLLTNSSYTNVTTGQVVEALYDSSVVTFTSAVNRVSRLVASQGDIIFSGGVIQVVDSVLIPPLAIYPTVSQAPMPYFIDTLNAALNGQFGSFLQEAANAPNSTFFCGDSAEAAKIALSGVPISAALQEIILQYSKYAMVAGQTLYSTSLTNGSSFTTADGINITITTVDGDTYVNSAKVTRKDILISNGVIHVIDNILNPNDPDARPQINSTSSISPVPSTSTTSNSTTPNHTPEIPQKSISTGGWAGIGVGISAAVLLVLGSVIFVIKKRGGFLQIGTNLHELGSNREMDGEELDGKPLRAELEGAISMQELEVRLWRQELDGRSLVHTLDHDSVINHAI